MKQLILLFCLVIPSLSYSQFPIGKNSKVAEKEIKSYLQSKGFLFLKKSSSDEKMEILEFSDEFTIVMGKNYYENITYINISCFKSGVMDKLKSAFNFTKWNYVGEIPNINNEYEAVYHYKQLKIRIPKPEDSYQFVVEKL